MAELTAREPDRLRLWPVVGRDHELGPLAQIASTRHSPGAVIVGSVGVGKTRLAAEAVRLAEEAGRPSVRIHGSQAVQQLPLAALDQLLPSGFDVEASSIRLVGAALDAITTRYQGTGTVVLVDDAHRLDDVAAYVLHRAVAAQLFTVIATARSGEPVSEAITALWKDQGARRIDLQPLTTADVEALVRSTLDGVVSSEALHRLITVAAGNPLVLRELLFGATEDGGLARIGGVWQLTAPLAAARKLGDLINARLSDLSPQERDALELLVIGQPLGLTQLYELVGTAPIEALERKGLVVVDEDGMRLRASLIHPIYEEAVRARMPVTALIRHSRALADAVEAHGMRRSDDLMRWAVWRCMGGGPVDARRMRIAAERALVQRAAAPLRERLARLAFEADPTFEIGLVLCMALYDLCRHAEAEALLSQIEQQAGTRSARVEVAVVRSWFLGFGAGQIEAALRVLRQVGPLVDDEVGRAEVRAQEGNLLAYAGSPLAALQRVEPLLDSPSEQVRSRASVAACMAYLLTGEFEAAERNALVAIEYHGGAEGRRAFLPAAGLVGLRVRALSGWGRGELACAVGQQALKGSTLSGDERGRAWNAAALAGAEVSVGDLPAARGHALEAANVFAALGHRWVEGWCLAFAVMAAVFQEDRDAADEFAAQLDLRAPRDLEARLFETEVDRARMWHRSLTDLSAARAEAVRHLDAARSTGAIVAATTLVHDLVRLGDPATAARCLSSMTIPAGWSLGNAMVRHVHAAADGDADELARCSVMFEELGYLMYAAEAAIAAAVAYTAINARQAARQQNRSANLACRCGGLRTPLMRPPGAATILTRRERELSALAAGGASNREIARRLVISERTVENHLSRVYAKLGVDGRADLPDALDSGAGPG